MKHVTSRNPLLFLPLCALLQAHVPAPGLADEWPQWRGPDRTGVSQETGLADAWPADGPQEVWRVDFLGEGYGAVAVTGDRLFVQGTRDGESIVFALDKQNGKEIWSHSLGPRLIQDKGNGPRSTPTVKGDTVYVVNGQGQVAALAGEDGSLRWQVDMLERFGASNPRWGISESPLVEDDAIYVMPGGTKATVAALDPRTGETIWTSSGLTDRASYSSLVPMRVGNIDALVGFTQSAGIGLKKSDGSLLWRYEAPANRTANAATPVIGRDLVFYSSAYGTGGGALRLMATANGIETEEAWFEARLQNHHGGVVLYDDHLYGFFGPALGCIELETGETKWRARSVGKGSLTIADGKLFLLSERRGVALAEATPDGYRERGRFEIEDRGQPTWAYPVVSGGRLYIRNQNLLRVFDVAAGGAQPTSGGAGR